MRTRNCKSFQARISLFYINHIAVSIRNWSYLIGCSPPFGHTVGLSAADKITFLKGQRWICT